MIIIGQDFYHFAPGSLKNPDCPIWWHPHSSSSFCVSHHGNCLSSFFLPACHSPSLVQPKAQLAAPTVTFPNRLFHTFSPLNINTYTLMAFKCWRGEGSTYHLILPFNFSSDLLVACLALRRYTTTEVPMLRGGYLLSSVINLSPRAFAHDLWALEG